MRVLFVCTANICRSVMAEAILKRQLSGQNDAIQVESAGIDVVPELAPDPSTKQVCSAHGLDIGSHLPRQLTQTMLNQSDIILCLADNHRASILGAYPKLEDKVFLLKQFHNNRQVRNPSLEDPTGRSLRKYERCFSEIEEEMSRIAPILLKATSEAETESI